MLLVCFEGLARFSRRRFVRGSREISLASPCICIERLHGMTQVSLHYTHTFEKLRFHFQFQSERSFDPSDKFVW